MVEALVVLLGGREVAPGGKPRALVAESILPQLGTCPFGDFRSKSG